MLNRVVLVGRLTKDPELRVSQSDIAVANFNLAVNRRFSDQNGERGADFINIVCFRKQAENVNQYLSKGSQCAVDGRIQTRNYENKDGQRVYVTEVVAESVQFLDSKSENSKPNNNQQNYSNQARQTTGSKPSYEDNPFQNNQGPVNVQDDDLPF
ncbi:single-stranded DNA-binding protein [Jeotgalicoccus marinus]|uniref:single-stranded DNA-binding protein n=1 Tax=Jeotgalicoccus marinus TaxID=516700 RepID=UPI00041F8888|nr:single-stranded DNA-binding protein [Jeotgalicoccus marinus]